MPMARRSLLEGPPPAPADAPAITDDPFADLVDSDETTDIRHAPNDDTATLRSLFGAPPSPATIPVERRGSWPQNNYGPAYEAIRANRRPHRRRLADRHEAEVWDLDDAVPGKTLPPSPTTPPNPEPEPTAWPKRNLDEARTWLDGLSDDTPRATEANLVATLRGERAHPLPQIVIDATEVLFARTRTTTPATRTLNWTERILHGAAIGFLILFAVALLQLLLV